MYEGAIIKETLADDSLLDYLTINNVEIWKTGAEIKYWTMVFFRSDTVDFPQRLSETIIDGWFADMKKDNIKYIRLPRKFTVSCAASQETRGNRRVSEKRHMRTVEFPRKSIIFRNKILKYEIGNSAEKEQVLNYMRSIGIPDSQFNWSE